MRVWIEQHPWLMTEPDDENDCCDDDAGNGRRAEADAPSPKAVSRWRRLHDPGRFRTRDPGRRVRVRQSDFVGVELPDARYAVGRFATALISLSGHVLPPSWNARELDIVRQG